MKHYKLTDTQHKSIDKLLKYFKLFPEYTQWDWDGPEGYGVTWIADRIIEELEIIKVEGIYNEDGKYWLNIFRQHYYDHQIKRRY